MGDVLYIKDGATTGIAVNNPLQEPFSMLSSVALLKPDRDVLDENFLCRWLNSPEAVASMTGQMGGSAIRRLTLKKIGASSMPIAPLSEQRRIVAKLDRLSARSAAARDHLARTAKLAARAKQAILASAFCGDLSLDWRTSGTIGAVATDRTGIDGRVPDLGDIPKIWAWRAIGSVAEVSGGLTKNRKRMEMELKAPYLRVANVYANELRLDDVAEIGCSYAEFRRSALAAGDLLVVEGNGSKDQIGRVAMWSGEVEGCLHQNHLIRVRSGSTVSSRYLLYWMLSPNGRIAIETVASSSSGLHTLSLSKVKGMPVPLCSHDEQDEIVRRIEAAFARIDRLTEEATRAAHLLDRLDERLLAKAFRGELVPQNPEDEPAEILLSRIREARASAAKPKRGPPSRARG